MIRAGLLLVVSLIAGCVGAPVVSSPDEVLAEVVSSYELALIEFRGFHPARRKTLLERFQREHARAVRLDGPLPAGREVVRYVIHDANRLGSPPIDPVSPLNSLWVQVVGLCREPEPGRFVIHLAGRDPIRVLRHELEHARNGGGHEGPRWARIEVERHADRWAGE